MQEDLPVVLYETADGQAHLDVRVNQDTVWLSQAQMSRLFERERSVLTKHIGNVFKEGELFQEGNVQNLHIAQSSKPVAFYSLDVIISVGYRIKSKRGTQFRVWANRILKEYLLRGIVFNNNRLHQLGKTLQLMRRVENHLDSSQVLDVVESYTRALDLLDAYDHQSLRYPEGSSSVVIITYEECRTYISGMKFAGDSALFGNEKDDSFKGIMGAIYQSFDGGDLYPSVEEKAAQLLYMITKNHSFSDGNKRIAAAIFLYFLDRNGILFFEGHKIIDDRTLVALVIMIAESNPREKDVMVVLTMNFIS